MLTKIFTMLLEDYLNETAYDAKMACLSFSIHATTTGFLTSFYGCAQAPLLGCSLLGPISVN